MILFCELQQISTCVSRILESSVKDHILSKFACESLTCMLSSSSLKFYLPQLRQGYVLHRRLLFCSQEGPLLGRHPLGRHPPPPADTPTPNGQTPHKQTPLAQCMLGYTPCPVHAGIHPPPPAATATDGTHPTGMHSCFYFSYWT